MKNNPRTINFWINSNRGFDTTFANIKSWGQKLLFSVGDQGLYSLSNFIINILLARWLSVNDYGTFAFSFSIFLVVAGLHNAIIIEPMSVLGPSRYRDDLYNYLNGVFRLHFLFSIFSGFIGLLISLLILPSFPKYAEGLLGASIGLPFILSFWVLRRVCYLFSKPNVAALGSLIYALITTGIFILQTFIAVNAMSAFLLMSVSSILGCVAIIISLKNPDYKFLSLPRNTLKNIWEEQWQYGRWMLRASIVNSFGSSIYVPALGLLLGLYYSGIFRGYQNLILPLQQIGAALYILFLPWLSSRAEERSFVKKSRLIILSHIVVGLCYFLFVFIFGNRLLVILYNNNEYNTYEWLLIYFAISGFIDLVSSSISTALRAKQKPEAIFWAQVGNAATALTICLFAIWKFGIIGAAIGIVLSSLITLVFLLMWYTKINNRSNPFFR